MSVQKESLWVIGVRVRIHQPHVGFKVLESVEDTDWLNADG
jgi:hypothetical protein